MLEVVAFVRIANSSSTACASARPPRVSHAACLLRNKSDVTGAPITPRAPYVIGRALARTRLGHRWRWTFLSAGGDSHAALHARVREIARSPPLQDGAVVTLPRIELNTANSQTRIAQTVCRNIFASFLQLNLSGVSLNFSWKSLGKF